LQGTIPLTITLQAKLVASLLNVSSSDMVYTTYLIWYKRLCQHNMYIMWMSHTYILDALFTLPVVEI